MVSIFPDLFTYAIFVPLVFRLFLGTVAFNQSWTNYPLKRIHSLIHGVVGAMLLAGIFIQPLAIIGFCYQIYTAKKSLGNERLLHITFAVIYLALVFLGPGAFAIDLPL